jgi:hypothetical protein
MHELRIHIDRKAYHSHSPIVAKALYALGDVQSSHELYREARGDHEDELIRNGDEMVHLREDEHFYSATAAEHSVTIIVNGRPKVVTAKELSFAEIVALAFDTPPTGPTVIFTVTYRKGGGKNHEGTLIPGESVRIKEGMIFNVTPTDKS